MGGATAAWLATATSAAAAIVAGFAYLRRYAAAELASRLLLTAAAALSMWSLIRLGLSFRDRDFSLAYVVSHSRSGISAPYRVAGIWGGMGGSLLLWVALSAVCATIASWVRGFGSSVAPATLVRFNAARTAVFGVVIAGLLTIDLALVSPFETLDVPAVRGTGLVPILEHPAMLYHPPLLYLGLVMLIVPFADAVAGAWLEPGSAAQAGQVRHQRRWLIGSWLLLVVGLATGANWAYVELGWGGYWAWDPIENTALLPWLAVTAALHAGRVRREGGRGGTGRLAFAALPYVLTTAGSLLTRSGATVSVHAFGEAVAVGRALIALLVFLVAIAATAIAVSLRVERGALHQSPAPAPQATPGFRRKGLWLSTILFGAATFVVFSATTWPIVDPGEGGGAQRAIEGTFFANLLAPMTIIGLVVVAVIPRVTDTDSPKAVAQRLLIPAIGAAIALVISIAVGWPIQPTGLLIAAAGAAAAGALAGSFERSGTRPAVHIVHFGFALFIIAVAGSTATNSVSVTLDEGESISVGGYTMTLTGVELRETELEPKESVVATVAIRRGGADTGGSPGATVATLEPRRDVYTDKATVLPENALRSTPIDDIQVALRRADDNRALLDISVRPLAWWLWWGAAAMVFGALLLLRPLRPARA